MVIFLRGSYDFENSVDIAFAAPVIYPFVKGGAEKRIYEVGRRLAGRGHDITIYSRQWWDGPSATIFEQMQLRAVGPASDLYAEGDRRSIPSALGLAGRLVKPLIKADHDLIITPVAPYLHVFTVRLASGLRRTPLVVTWHEVWGEYWFRYMGSSGYAGKAVEWTASRLPQHAVVPSQTTADRLHKLAPRQNIEVIPNGIDVSQITSTAPATDGYDVLYAGRLIEDKNVALLIDAFERLDTDMRLGIIGDGPEADRLRAQARQSTAADRIDFLGFLEDYDSVIAHMRAADVFVSPSIREGFGITLLEAMAADCIVITVEHEYSAGSEIVADAGFVVQPTTKQLSRTISRALVGDVPDRLPVERAADFDWDVVTAQAESFYDSIV